MAEISLEGLVTALFHKYGDRIRGPERIWSALHSAVDPRLLVDNLAETFRVSSQQVMADVAASGFGAWLAQLEETKTGGQTTTPRHGTDFLVADGVAHPFADLFAVTLSPDPHHLAQALPDGGQRFDDLVRRIGQDSAADPFVSLYRHGVLDYFQDFMAEDGQKIGEYVARAFSRTPLRYLVTSGIGANEQFCHFVATIHNANPNRSLTWLVINSPRQLRQLPDDATLDNTLFLEFSRSGVTEETVKIHEYTPRAAQRVVFANKGPLRGLGERDGNLLLGFPDEVAGRFGRNKTPILLAPMLVAGLDVAAFWQAIQSAIDAYDLGRGLPMLLARFLYLNQVTDNRNFIYVGCNDDRAALLVDEFLQFWNEGVNKKGNDFLASRFWGLPRDSHMHIEGLLANRDKKIGMFLLRDHLRDEPRHPLVSFLIDPVDAEHQGLHYGDEEVILAFANYKRFAELMPTVLIRLSDPPGLRHAAVLGQVFMDTTYLYSRMKNIDPGSNPEVKAVRDRSATLLTLAAQEIRQGVAIEQVVRSTLKC